MSDHPWRDRIPAFVLGALGPEETAAFEEHLRGCAPCREEVEAYRRVVAGLASRASPTADPAGAGSQTRQRALRLPDPQRRRDGPRVPPAVAWLAAAAGLTVAAIAGAAYLEARGASEEVRLDYQQALARVGQLEAARADRDSMLATLQGEGLRTATLTTAGREAVVRLFWNPDRGRLLITALDLPPAPAGRIYQVWGMAPDEDPVGLGTFQTDGDGLAVVARELRRRERFERSAVTEEPAGGSPRPTATPLLRGPWGTGGG